MGNNKNEIPTDNTIESVYGSAVASEKVKEDNSDYDVNGVNDTNVTSTKDKSDDVGATFWY